MSGHAVLSPCELELQDGQTATALHARFAEPWIEALPWVFVDKSGARIWHSQGATRTRAERAWVVTPGALRPEIEAMDLCQCVGILDCLGFPVYEVRSAVDFVSPLGDRYRVICGAPDETDEVFAVSGNSLAGVIGSRTVYQGLPTIRLEDSDGRLRPAEGQRQWRPVGSAGAWRQGVEVAGILWLRWVDAQGSERYRRQVAVVPSGFRVDRTIAHPGQAGSYRFSGLGGGHVNVRCPAEGGVTAASTGPDEITVSCPPVAGTSLPMLAVELRWEDGQPIEFNLPYPQCGGVFLMGGRVLPGGAGVPVERCGGLRLVVLDPANAGRYDLEGELIGTPFGFRDRLPPLQDGRLDLSLHSWQDRLSAILATQDDPDVEIRLYLSRYGQQLSRVLVTWFDGAVVPDRERDRVTVSTDSPDAQALDWPERLSLSMIPLWDPARTPRQLERCTDEPLYWSVPGDLEIGPWWIIGRDRDWTRFRPLLWSVMGEAQADTQVVSPLEQAIREPDRDVRQQQMATVLSTLGAEPEAPDWPRLFAYVDLTREFHPAALDVLRELPSHPSTLAMALLRAGDQNFERVWALSDGLPFLWWLVPIEHWLAASSVYLAMVQDALGDLDSDGQLLASILDDFRNRAQSRYPGFHPLCDWLQEHLMPWKPLGQSLMRVFRAHPGLLGDRVAMAEGELQARHVAGEMWPIGSEVLDRANACEMSFPQFRFENRDESFRPVRCAPFVAADAAIRGVDSDNRLLLELRLIRAFDTQWFDTVYSDALAWGLAALPPEIKDER